MTAFAAACILGLTSLPSVGKSLGWREFRFIQSKLGWLCLLLALTHCVLSDLPNTFVAFCYFPSNNLLPAVVPAVTVALKIPLILMDSCLTKIRRGHEYRGCLKA